MTERTFTAAAPDYKALIVEFMDKMPRCDCDAPGCLNCRICAALTAAAEREAALREENERLTETERLNDIAMADYRRSLVRLTEKIGHLKAELLEAEEAETKLVAERQKVRELVDTILRAKTAASVMKNPQIQQGWIAAVDALAAKADALGLSPTEPTP